MNFIIFSGGYNMALNPLVDSRDVRFVLYELLELEQLNRYPKYADYDRDMFEDTLNLAEKIAIEQLYPVYAEGDSISCQYDPGTNGVKVPEVYKPGYKALAEAGFISLQDDPEIGGAGMPIAISTSCFEYFVAGNGPLAGYASLTHGAADLITNFGTDEQKALYLEKMLTGQWTGTMCLTEPDAGSDVGALKSKAVKQSDGTYLITGQKIFITNGEHDLAENIIHPVLARIEGDPAGSKGISIFIVPKYRVNPDGSMGDFNDVVCSGIEHKMGIKGSATCTLNFGDNGNCVGYLLGEQRKGMRIMFQMMNEARLGVAMQGLAVSSVAYMHAINYAKSRIQGSDVTQLLNPEAPKVTIIHHPDVKRMLLWMKSYVEGMRALTYYLAFNLDLERACEGEEEMEAKALAEILLPICKAGNTDTSWLVTSEAIQVYGGYGYCSDYPVEKYARDSKILSIFEGTNGIQSIDLTMRKILMNPEQYNYSVWRKRVDDTIASAKGIVDEKYVEPVEKGIERLDEVIEMMKQQLGESRFLHIFMNATPLQQAMFMIILAWMHLWSLTITLPKMNEIVGDAKGEEREKLLADNQEAAFYSGKVLSSQFFLGVEVPKYMGRVESILNGETAVIKSSEEIFTGAAEI
jgi:alkylation response protein AidB-like acyl-CoA dehydrogenase